MTDKLVTTRTEPHEFVLAPRPGLEHGCYCGEPRDAAIHALVTRTERQLRREADATAALTASSDADGTGSQVESMESEAEKWGRLAEVMIPNEAPMKTWARRAAIEFCGLLGDEQRDRILAAIDTLRAANADLHGYAAKQRAEISDLRVEVESLKGKNELLVRTVEYSRGEVERLLALARKGIAPEPRPVDESALREMARRWIATFGHINSQDMRLIRDLLAALYRQDENAQGASGGRGTPQSPTEDSLPAQPTPSEDVRALVDPPDALDVRSLVLKANSALGESDKFMLQRGPRNDLIRDLRDALLASEAEVQRLRAEHAECDTPEESAWADGVNAKLLAERNALRAELSTTKERLARAEMVAEAAYDFTALQGTQHEDLTRRVLMNALDAYRAATRLRSERRAAPQGRA